MHAVFVAPPGHGHVNPMLPLAERVVAEGDRVTFAATEEFAPAVRATGSAVLPLDDAFRPPPEALRSASDGSGGGPAAFFGRLGAAVPGLMARVAAMRPDVLVYGVMLAWLSPATRALDAPRVAFFPTYAVPEGRVPADWFSAGGRSPGLLRVLPEAGRAFAAEGLNVVALPRLFQPDPGAFDGRYLFAGPMLRTHEPADPALLDRLARRGERPLLYVSLGTAVSDNPAFYRTVFAAFAGSEWLVVAATGWSDPQALGDLPANVVTRRSVPQLAVLERADVFVTHGGMNSTMEGLWHGVPLVVVPHQGEQALTGQRVQELGLGRALDPAEATGEAVRAAVEAVHADPGSRARIAAMQAEMRAADGAAGAAEAIRRYAGGEPPPPAPRTPHPGEAAGA